MSGRTHNCMDYRHRSAYEGDDALTERCMLCGKVRYESDGVRPMAWYVDRTNPVGHRYVYADPRNGGPSIWKPPPTRDATGA